MPSEINPSLRVWLSLVLVAVAGGCASPRSAPTPVSVDPLAEVYTGQPTARVPATRIGGRFVVRADLVASGALIKTRTLVGYFAIDPSAPVSVISPDWLDSQGVTLGQQIQVQTVKDPKERSLRWRGQTLSPRVARDVDLRLSGAGLRIKDFRVSDTTLVGPPESAKACCDGILGRDFLQQYILEFEVAEAAPAIVLWRPINFSLERSQAFNTASRKLASPRGTPRWLMTNGERSSAPNRTHAHDCAQRLSSELLRGEFAACGNFILDLSRNRVALDPEQSAAGAEDLRSGLRLRFRWENGQRVLSVMALSPGERGDAWREIGLRPGSVITEIDSAPAATLDLWELERSLARGIANTAGGRAQKAQNTMTALSAKSISFLDPARTYRVSKNLNEVLGPAAPRERLLDDRADQLRQTLAAPKRR